MVTFSEQDWLLSDERQHRLSATDWRHEMAERFAVWTEITGQATGS